MIWALVIILASDATPRISWYWSLEDCRAHVAVQSYRHTSRGEVVEWAGCRSVSRERLRPAFVEMVPHEF